MELGEAFRVLVKLSKRGAESYRFAKMTALMQTYLAGY
jgi:hypothetical protein